VIAVAQRRDTIPITCHLDRQAHDVTDDNVATGRPTGAYEALCGHLVVAAPMIAPVGRPCAKCTAVVASHRSASTTARVRRPRHRKGDAGRWKWIARMW
jgi:hypothetical protein